MIKDIMDDILSERKSKNIEDDYAPAILAA